MSPGIHLVPKPDLRLQKVTQNVKHKKTTLGDFNSSTTTSHPPPPPAPPQNPPPPPLTTATHTSTIPPPPPPPLNHNSFLNPLNDNSSTSFSNPLIVGGDILVTVAETTVDSQERAEGENEPRARTSRGRERAEPATE
ncbi:hypothetical protein Tco_1129260, partial [Tanacetum coccineum]